MLQQLSMHKELLELLISKFIKTSSVPFEEDNREVWFQKILAKGQLIVAAILVLSGWKSSEQKISCEICQRELQIEYYKTFEKNAVEEIEENVEDINMGEKQTPTEEGSCLLEL